MTPTVLNFPSVANPSRITWQLNRLDTRFKSPLSGTFQDIQRPGANWVCDMSWGVLSYADSQQLAAWSDQMSQAGVRTYLPNFIYIPQGSIKGVVIVNGANQTGTSLVCNQAPVGTNLVVAGDFIVITSGTHTQLLRITKNSASDGTGNITLNFTPAMRFSPTNGSQIFFGVTPTTTPAVYKSDWQGNQLQYSTPRTNVLEYSETPMSWTVFSVTATSKTSIVPSGTAALFAAGASPPANAQCYPPIYTSTFNGSAVFTLIVEQATSSTVIFEFYDDTANTGIGSAAFNFSTQVISPFAGEIVSATSLGTGPNGGALWRLTVQPHTPFVIGHLISFVVWPAGNPAVASVGTIIHAAQVEAGAISTSIIATASSPVTVTDYTLAGNQLTFASAPANASVLTWTDGAGTIFHLPSGDGSTTVFYTGLPLVAFAFAKPSSSFTYTAPRIAALSLALEEDINV